jgi:MFS transporter, DHA3 family, macrolide efflux protein
MPDVPGTRDPGARDLLRLPDFRRLYLAQAVSDLGDGMTYLALFLLVLDLTGSTAAIALMSILVALPPVLVGLFAGAFADRHDRRRIMVVSDTLRAVVLVAMVLAARSEAVPLLFALACTQAVVGTFFGPARVAMIPRAVPREGLLAANSLGQATRMVMGVVGAGVTGMIAAVFGAAWPVLAFDAATFLVSVVLVLRVTPALGIPEAMAAGATAAREGIGSAVRDGLRLIAGSRTLIAALGGVAVTMLGIGAINVLFIPFIVRDLGASPAWAGPLEAAQTISMILAGAMVTAMSARLSLPRLFTGGIAGTAVCVALLAAAPGPWAVLLIMFAVGWFVMPVQASTMTLVQRATTDATRGRVAGALNAAIQGASIGSMAAAGILADIVGIRMVFLGGAAVAAVAAVVSWLLFRGADPAVTGVTAHASGAVGASGTPGTSTVAPGQSPVDGGAPSITPAGGATA